MEELAKLEEERGNPEYIEEEITSGKMHVADKQRGKVMGVHLRERTASKEVCDFISSLQLIPVNMIVYRQQYDSVNPTAVIAPAIVATFFSTAVAVVFCKAKELRRRA